MEVGREKIVGRIQYLFKIAFPPALPIFLFHFPRGHLFPSQIKRKRIQPAIYLILSGEEFELSTFVPVSEVADED